MMCQFVHHETFLVKNKKIESLFHVSEMIEHPYECIKGFKKSWKHVLKNKKINRQNFEKFYFITGSLWYFTKKFFIMRLNLDKIKIFRQYNN